MAKPFGGGRRERSDEGDSARQLTHADLAERFTGDKAFRVMLAERWEALEERVRSQA